MKQKIRNTLLAALIGMGMTLGLAARAAEDAKEQDLKSEAQMAITNFVKADPSLQKLVDSSPGFVVFPSVGKGGLIVGGAHGKGIVFENGKPVGEASMTQASIGAQAGGQTFAELLIFETPAVLEEFKTGKFEMTAEASAVAASEGASARAKFNKGVAAFVLPKSGLMASAAVGGQKFKFKPMQ